MTENTHLLSRVKQILPANLCGYAATKIGPESYGPYIDKIRAFFVPSLEHRIYLLLEQFLYSADSGRKEQFFRTRTQPGGTAECDSGTFGVVVRSVVKHVARNDLVYRFLDSIVLRRRLNKICRELNAIALENDVARSLNAWGLANENDPMDRNWLMRPGAERSVNSATLGSTKKPVRRVGSLTGNDVNRNGVGRAIERPTPSEFAREFARLVPDARRKNHLATESMRSNDEVHEASREASRNTESKTARHKSSLKMIIRKARMEDCGCPALSGRATARLRLPCKPSDLIGRIFDADPSLSESCLIVIKRKFRADVCNLCSCLNDALEKAGAESASALRLHCEIRPGYIGFKLKVDKAADTCLFVGRVPICQNVPKHTARSRDSVVSRRDASPSAKANGPNCSRRCKDDGRNFCDTLDEKSEMSSVVPISQDVSKHTTQKPVISRCDSSTKADEPKCLERCKDNGEFCDTLASVNEGSETSTDTCPSDRDFINSHTTVNTSQCATESSSEKITAVSTIAQNDNPECTRDLAVSCCNGFGESDIEREEIPNVTPRSGPETDTEEHRKAADSMEINRGSTEEEREENLIDSSDSVVSQASGANCTREGSTKEGNSARVSRDEELDDSSRRTGGGDKRDRTTRSPDTESHPGRNKDFAASSIASFVRHPENDKQLVELNCNCFSDGEAIDEHSDRQDGGSLNSINVEVGRGSGFSRPADDFVSVAVTDYISDIVYPRKTGNDDATGARIGDCSETTTKLSDNNLLTTSVQTSRLKVSSKGITVDISYPRTVVSLAFDDERGVSTVVRTRDGCDRQVNAVCTAKEILPTVARRGGKAICDKTGFNMNDRTRDFIRSRKGFPILKERLGSSESPSDSLSAGDFYAEDSTYVTSGASRCRRFSRSTASEFATSNERGGSRNARKSRKPSKYRPRGRSSSSRGILHVNSFAATRYRRTSCRCRNNYHGDTRPQLIFVLTRFRNSVDRSLGRIKRLIHAKLDGVLFNNRTKTLSMWKTLWKTRESSENMRKPNYSRQDYSITSCSLSTSDYCKRGCIFSNESSDVTLSILKTRSGGKSKRGKFCDYGFAGRSSEVLAGVRSIEASLWSHDLLTPTRENLEEQKSRGSTRDHVKKN